MRRGSILTKKCTNFPSLDKKGKIFPLPFQGLRFLMKCDIIIEKSEKGAKRG